MEGKPSKIEKRSMSGQCPVHSHTNRKIFGTDVSVLAYLFEETLIKALCLDLALRGLVLPYYGAFHKLLQRIRMTLFCRTSAYIDRRRGAILVLWINVYSIESLSIMIT